MTDLTTAIKILRPNSSFSVEGEIVKWCDTNNSQPTQQQINEKIAELVGLEPMRVLREERNRKLAQTDWRASSDLTLSSEWTTYRQALRDLPSTATPTLDEDGNLQNVTWPEEPT